MILFFLPALRDIATSLFHLELVKVQRPNAEIEPLTLSLKMLSVIVLVTGFSKPVLAMLDALNQPAKILDVFSSSSVSRQGSAILTNVQAALPSRY